MASGLGSLFSTPTMHVGLQPHIGSSPVPRGISPTTHPKWADHFATPEPVGYWSMLCVCISFGKPSQVVVVHNPIENSIWPSILALSIFHSSTTTSSAVESYRLK